MLPVWVSSAASGTRSKEKGERRKALEGLILLGEIDFWGRAAKRRRKNILKIFVNVPKLGITMVDSICQELDQSAARHYRQVRLLCELPSDQQNNRPADHVRNWQFCAFA